jgi:RNA polymerase sigma-70 factor (ECF subfamily)
MRYDTSNETRPERLLEDLRQGRGVAFDYLFCTYYKDLCRFAAAFVGSLAVAEDVVQDFFTRVWERGIQVEREEALESYLYVAVRNRCVGYVRGQGQRVGIEFLRERAAEESMRWEEEEWRCVWEAVEGLPERCRVILKLVVVEEMRYAEAAEKLGISLNTVKTQMKIAYRLLRERL